MKTELFWSAQELELLASGISNKEVAARTGRSTAAVRGKRQRLAEGAAAPAEPAKPAQYEDDRARASADFWKREHDALKKKYERALREQSAIEQLVGLAREVAPRSYETAAVPPQEKCGEGKAQSAVLMLSDTHVGQVISPNQTLGHGDYDFATFLARLKFYEDAAVSILRDHTTTKISELVIAFGGDMLHGALNHGAEAAQHHTLFAQWYGAGHAFAQFIQNVSACVPSVRIYATQGNHTRFANQHRMPTENRHSNFDSFCYEYTRALTSGIKNVQWNLDEQPVAMFEVQGFQFQLLHGDTLRGGDRALGIPNHSVGRLVSANSQLFGKHDLPSPHYYLVGHLHRSIVLPHAKGSVIINGGFAGLDGYGLANGFSPVDPSQTMFFVHPKYGKSASYEIALKFAKLGAGRPYTIPGGYL